jgi:hypothetical protein
LEIEASGETKVMADTNNTAAPKPRLREQYDTQVVPALIKQFNYKNMMQAPKIEKVIINMGVGVAGQTGGDPKQLDNAIRDLTAISGQKPSVTRAKKSIANFKARECMSSWTACSASRFPVCVTSRASIRTALTVVATSRWG